MSSSMPFLCAVGLSLGLSAHAVAAEPAAPRAYQMSLNNAQVSDMPDGRLIVTMEASGDLKGLVTLTLQRDGSRISGGEFVFVARYVEYVAEDGSVIPDGVVQDESQPHSERARFVDKGTLSGSVVGGSLTVGDAGVVTGLSAVSVAVQSGSLSFSGASGDGSSDATGLRDVQASSGTLTLIF